MNKEIKVNPIIRMILPFVLGFSGVFIMMLFQTISFHPVKSIVSFLNKKEAKEIIKNTKIEEKLKDKSNTFKIKNGPIFPQVYGDDSENQAKAYGVIDLKTGDIYAQKNITDSVPIASITKLMSAIVALDLVKNDEVFTISQNASKVSPTRIGVVPGEKMKVKELLNAMLLTSANDAAQVLMEGVNTKYGQDIFVKAMNYKAKFLNLENTNFSNPQGFDSKDNYSSVSDLAVLTNYALNHYPEIVDIVKKDYEFLPRNKNHKQFDLYNWNGLLGVYPGVQGMKIGNTDDAGYTTIVVAQRNGKKLASIVLGAPGVVQRDLWAAQLLDSGFKKLDVPPARITDVELKAKYSGWKYWN